MGQIVEISFSNGEEVKGSILKISDRVINDGKEGYDYIIAQVKIEGESSSKLIEGITFTAQVVLEENKEALVIPRGEYINDSSAEFVYRISKDEKSAEKAKKTKVISNYVTNSIRGIYYNPLH